MFKYIVSLKNKIHKLLRWSEKWTKTDMVYLARGGFWLTSGHIVSMISGVLLAIAFANLLPKETYGIYKYVLSIASILAIPTLSGMNTAINRSIAQGYEGSFVKALKTKIRWGLLGGLTSIGLAGYYYVNGDTILTLSFLIVAMFLPFMNSLSLYQSILVGKKEFKLFSKYNVIINIIVAITMVAILFFTNNILLVIFSYFIAYTLLHAIFLKVTLQKFALNNKIDPTTISYGKHLSLMGIISIVAGQIDKILIFHYLGTAELAIYSFSIAMPNQIKNAFKNINTLALPKFSERPAEEIKKTIFRKIKIFSTAMLLIVILYILITPYIFKLLFPQYLEAIFYSQLFAVTLMGIPFILIGSILMSAQKQQKKLYFFNLCDSIILIIFLFLGAYFYGILGVIIAKIIHKAIMSCILSYIMALSWHK